MLKKYLGIPAGVFSHRAFLVSSHLAPIYVCVYTYVSESARLIPISPLGYHGGKGRRRGSVEEEEEEDQKKNRYN